MNKEILINTIKNLPEKRDDRYSNFIKTKFREDKFTLLQYLEGNLEEIACYSEDKYKICILDDYHMLLFNKDANDIPVPSGLWMDWWEKDFQKYFGIGQKSYSEMSKKDRALLECKLEMKKSWPQQEYFYLYAEFYNSKEYDAWWWDESIPVSEKQGPEKEEYWKENYLEKELFNEVIKLFNLKNTEFKVDKNLQDSECDKYFEEKIICHLKMPEHAIHEGVHAFFAERTRDLMKKFGDKEFWARADVTVEDENLEDVVARVIETNFKGKTLNICTEDIQERVTLMSKMEWSYENIELGKNIMRLYLSVYEHNCIYPKDITIYNDIKNDINPTVIYNKLARYVGTHELLVLE